MGDWTRFADAAPEVGRFVVLGLNVGEDDLWPLDPVRWTDWRDGTARRIKNGAGDGSIPAWRYPDPHPSQVEAIERDVLRRVAKQTALFASYLSARAAAGDAVAVGSEAVDVVTSWLLWVADGNEPLRAEGLPVGGEDG